MISNFAIQYNLFGTAEKQRILLEEEGVVFVKDKVDFKKYGWKGPGEADEPRQETLF